MENKVESGLNWIRVRFSYSGKKGEDAGGDTLVLLVTFRVAEGARPDRKSSLSLLARAVLYRLCFLLSEQLLPERKTMSQSKLEWRMTQIDEQVYSIIEWLKCVIMAHRGDVALKDSRSLEPPLDRKPSLWPHLTWYQKLFFRLDCNFQPCWFHSVVQTRVTATLMFPLDSFGQTPNSGWESDFTGSAFVVRA